MLITDISAFYENIDITRLISDLENFSIPSDNKQLLQSCLNRWAEPKSRGLVQGVSPSFILADVYLNSIDRGLINEGIRHLRYEDDIRIFCRTKTEAILALHTLIRLCRQKGLNLQTAKSKILNKSSAEYHITGVTKILSESNRKIVNKIKELGYIENPYGTPAEIERLANQGQINLQILEELFKKYHLSENSKFDNSTFHFFINRLRALRSNTAVDYCLDLLLKNPEETPHIMKYFDNMKDDYIDIARRLCLYLKNGYIIGEYQYFKFLYWIYKHKIFTEDILSTFRELIKKSYSIEQIIIDICVLYIGENGYLSDLDYIESLYERSDNPIRKATIIYGIRKLPKSRRNFMYSRAKGDHDWVKLAV